MVLLVCGLLILAAGVHMRRSTRIPRGSVPLPGRVVDVDERRSTLSANRQRLYGVSVEYRDPRSGAVTVLPPDSHQPHAYEVGDEVTLMHDPESGLVRLPSPSRVAQTVMPFVFGAVVVGLGVWDLVG